MRKPIDSVIACGSSRRRPWRLRFPALDGGMVPNGNLARGSKRPPRHTDLARLSMKGKLPRCFVGDIPR